MQNHLGKGLIIYLYVLLPKIYNYRTCTNVHRRADLTFALSCDGINCKVVMPSTKCVCEIAGVVFSQALLDDSLDADMANVKLHF